ncbi:hypothetical protein F5Y15DRAFT_6526 [Xylariaceae sp. FL0016]|nr:hypothetical protein F5Y15DRAFT_6526 [Xylariaceae sp. FL0016]
MKSLASALLIVTASAAALRRRQGDNSCCFGLTSVGVKNETVEETHVGNLVLGGVFQQAGFCIDKSTKTIKDTLKHSCSMRAPEYQFECSTGTAGATQFDTTAPKSDGLSYLTYDNGPGTFLACGVSSGDDTYYNIYSTELEDKNGCIFVALALHNPSASCGLGNATISNATAISKSNTIAARTAQALLQDPTPVATTTMTVPGHGRIPMATHVGHDQSITAPSSASSAASISQVCSVAPSAPSIGPSKLGSPNADVPDGLQDTAAEVAISFQNSTIFQYTIHTSFLPPITEAKSTLCALQFRMPVCTDLPSGYPCYAYSGMEQEILSNSGMNFDLVHDDGNAKWNSSELHQIFPGDIVTIGTFDCGTPRDTYGGRKMTWNVTSVRNFGLNFLHADIGPNAEFKDGVGAWIVPCQ